jgi:dTDP-4-amino-4,6-dideoxygalactose transaminase
VTVDGEPAGSFGDAAFFSSQWSKPFTTGLGGIAQLNNHLFMEKMVDLESSAPLPGAKETLTLAAQLLAHQVFLNPRLYWFATNTHRTLSKLGIFVGSSTTRELEGEMPKDYLKKMGRLQSWLLKRRSSNMDQVNSHRKWLALEYDRLLGQKGIFVFKREEGAVLIRYPVRVNDKNACLAAAQSANIELGEWFDHPLHPAGCCLTGLNWDDLLYPNAVKAANETVNLPVHLKIDLREAGRIVEFIAPFAKEC